LNEPALCNTKLRDIQQHAVFHALTRYSENLGLWARFTSVLKTALKRAVTEPDYFTVSPIASLSVIETPDKIVPKRKNKDFFANFKSQAWWSLRIRFEQTYRVAQQMPVDLDAIIYIDPYLDELLPLQMEFSQISYSTNATGKIVIDKQPPGTLSPNRADATMIA
jgi:hypothetical protein